MCESRERLTQRAVFGNSWASLGSSFLTSLLVRFGVHLGKLSRTPTTVSYQKTRLLHSGDWGGRLWVDAVWLYLYTVYVFFSAALTYEGLKTLRLTIAQRPVREGYLLVR